MDRLTSCSVFLLPQRCDRSISIRTTTSSSTQRKVESGLGCHILFVLLDQKLSSFCDDDSLGLLLDYQKERKKMSSLKLPLLPFIRPETATSSELGSKQDYICQLASGENNGHDKTQPDFPRLLNTSTQAYLLLPINILYELWPCELRYISWTKVTQSLICSPAHYIVFIS